MTPTPSPTPLPGALLDHYLCYKASRGFGEQKFESRLIDLADQFQTRTVEIYKTSQYCNAVDKNGEGIMDPEAHLTCYKTRPPSPRSIQNRTNRLRHVKANVILTNQFGALERDVDSKKTELCLPTVEQFGAPTRILKPITDRLDSYEFYRARRPRQTPKFEERQVSVADQWIDEVVEIRKPKQVGIPTSKDDPNMNIINSRTHLTCYPVRASRFQRRFVGITNQVGSFRLNVNKPNMLCVPSDKQVLSQDEF